MQLWFRSLAESDLFTQDALVERFTVNASAMGRAEMVCFTLFLEIFTLDLLCLHGDQNVKTDIIGIKDTRNR